MAKKDGGPAFPVVMRNGDGEDVADPGLTLRDYFAAAALTGLARSFAEQTVDDYLPQFVAQDAYKLADAMLEARSKA